jgi:hypothetical protein
MNSGDLLTVSSKEEGEMSEEDSCDYNIQDPKLVERKN